MTEEQIETRMFDYLEEIEEEVARRLVPIDERLKEKYQDEKHDAAVDVRKDVDAEFRERMLEEMGAEETAS